MACYHPWSKDEVVLPCGQCVGCRAAHAREWAMRCMHEASLHDSNCFVTLTYDDGHLPPGGSLDRQAFPLFMKRLRKQISPQRVRYYHVGEYGTQSERPHYHTLLFGFDFPGKLQAGTRNGIPVFRSVLLEALWTDGLSEIGDVSAKSAAYLTGYVKRRMTGSWAKARYGSREPEYGTMSRNPGIGAAWVDKFSDEVFPVDSVVVGGKLCKPPRYYAERVAARSPVGAVMLDSVRLKRFQSRRHEDETAERLVAMERCAIARETLKDSRSL